MPAAIVIQHLCHHPRFDAGSRYSPPLQPSIYPSIHHICELDMKNCIIPSLAVLSGIGNTAEAWAGRRGSISSRSVGVEGIVGVKPSFVLTIRGGANEYETKFESAKSSVFEKAMIKVRGFPSLIFPRYITYVYAVTILCVDLTCNHRNNTQ